MEDEKNELMLYIQEFSDNFKCIMDYRDCRVAEFIDLYLSVVNSHLKNNSDFVESILVDELIIKINKIIDEESKPISLTFLKYKQRGDEFIKFLETRK